MDLLIEYFAERLGHVLQGAALGVAFTIILVAMLYMTINKR